MPTAPLPPRFTSAFVRALSKAAALAAMVPLLLSSCQRSEPAAPATKPATKSLELVAVHAIAVGEPSGLAYAARTQTLYMISDSRSEIFTIDSTGKILSALPVAAQDMEGITLSPGADTIYVVEETASQVTTFLANGVKLSSFPVMVRRDPKHALEGITLDHRGHLFVINEKNPTMLLEFAGRVELARQVLDYTSDISDICYDAGSDCFWIVSDESKKVIKISRAGALLGEWDCPATQGEGIALIGGRLYVVSDAEAKLYVFHRPS